MSNISEYNYETIENPYNNELERSDIVSGAASDSSPSGGAALRSPSDISPDALGEQSLGDLWIGNFIKSETYRPKKFGFYLNAKEGYIECMKLYVGSGGIIGGSLDIPDITTANSFHTDSLGNSWWGANVAGGYAAASAYILNTGESHFTNANITGTITGSTITGSTLQTTAVSSAYVSITGNDIFLYDATTGGGGTISGNTATINFPRTDSKSGTFIMQKRASSVHDSGNIMEMYHTALAADGADNYLFLGTYGLAPNKNQNFTDVVRIHAKSLIQHSTDAALGQARPTELNIYTNDAPGSESFNSDDASRAALSAVEGDTPASYNFGTSAGGAAVSLGIQKAAGYDVSLLIDTNGGWFTNHFYPYANTTIDLGSDTLRFKDIYSSVVDVNTIYLNSAIYPLTNKGASVGSSTYGMDRVYIGYDAVDSHTGYLDNSAGTLRWNGTAVSTTNGTVTSVATSGAITGGTITTTGTIQHSTANGYIHLPSGGTTYYTLRNSGSGTAAWSRAVYVGYSGVYLDCSAAAGPIVVGDSSVDLIPSNVAQWLGNAATGWGALFLNPGTSEQTDTGSIWCYNSGATNQFRGIPSSGWKGSFDMTAA